MRERDRVCCCSPCSSPLTPSRLPSMERLLDETEEARLGAQGGGPVPEDGGEQKEEAEESGETPGHTTSEDRVETQLAGVQLG